MSSPSIKNLSFGAILILIIFLIPLKSGWSTKPLSGDGCTIINIKGEAIVDCPREVGGGGGGGSGQTGGPGPGTPTGGPAGPGGGGGTGPSGPGPSGGTGPQIPPAPPPMQPPPRDNNEGNCGPIGLGLCNPPSGSDRTPDRQESGGASGPRNSNRTQNPIDKYSCEAKVWDPYNKEWKSCLISPPTASPSASAYYTGKRGYYEKHFGKVLGDALQRLVDIGDDVSGTHAILDVLTKGLPLTQPLTIKIATDPNTTLPFSPGLQAACNKSYELWNETLSDFGVPIKLVPSSPSEANILLELSPEKMTDRHADATVVGERLSKGRIRFIAGSIQNLAIAKLVEICAHEIGHEIGLDHVKLIGDQSDEGMSEAFGKIIREKYNGKWPDTPEGVDALVKQEWNEAMKILGLDPQLMRGGAYMLTGANRGLTKSDMICPVLTVKFRAQYGLAEHRKQFGHCGTAK